MNAQSKALDESSSGSTEDRTLHCSEDKDRLITAYAHICESYHKIDDFRAKLLGFLPLASGAGIFLLLNSALTGEGTAPDAIKYLVPIGVFGIVVTLGLFFYELYGIMKCGRLIDAGRNLEEALRWEGYGQFSTRPDVYPNPKRFPQINEPFAAGIVYPAVLGAWTYLALFGGGRSVAAWIAAALVSCSGFVGTVLFDYLLRSRAARRQR